MEYFGGTIRHLNSYSRTAKNSILYPRSSLPDYPSMPASTGHSSQSLKRCRSEDNILLNETKRAAATPLIGSAAKPMKPVPSRIGIRTHYSVPLRHC